MIGKISLGKSFRGCLLYCLHDKLEEQQKQTPHTVGRAEVLLYNQCYGNDKELVRQFNDVRQLNPKLAKPVLHITLGLSPGERLPPEKLREIAEDCAREMGFSNNQFVAILHKDTKHQHIHIVANRISFGGKTWSDSNNYQKIANYCRRMELKHQLKQVLNPRKFLAEELRNIPRLDTRKLRLKEDIQSCLKGSSSYSDFEQKMRRLNYQVIRSRGIAFRDPQKVYTKGSEVGYSLSTIERTLALGPHRQKQSLPLTPEQTPDQLTIHFKQPLRSDKMTIPKLNKKQVLAAVLKATQTPVEAVNSELLKEAKTHRKRHRPKLS